MNISIADLIAVSQDETIEVIWLYKADSLNPASVQFVNGIRNAYDVMDSQLDQFAKWLADNGFNVSVSFGGLKAKRETKCKTIEELKRDAWTSLKVPSQRPRGPNKFHYASGRLK